MCEHLNLIDLPIDARMSSPWASAAASLPLSTDVDLGRRSPTLRRKLWEIPHKYHCPVLGTCLHVDELRRLATKAGCAPQRSLSDYEVHVSAIAAASEKNALSLALQRALERKYAADVKRFARAKTADELERLWDQALADGQIQGALWAVMTHPRAPADMCALAYADVHMLSHQIGAGLSADLKALTEARERLAQVRRDSAAERARSARKLAEKDTRIEQLERELRRLAGFERDLATARERIAVLESDSTLRALRAEARTLADQLQSARQQAEFASTEAEQLLRRVGTAEQRCAELDAELADRKEEIRALERLTAPSPGGPCGCDGDCAHCANPAALMDGVDLRGRRILCVGGRGSLHAHYRELVQRCNGELVRHDGGREDSRQRLEALLAKADAVVCPADCVSHDAYLRTKRYCKRAEKPCVLIERSGIGDFAKALSRLAVEPRSWVASPVQTGQAAHAA
jgi:hypothetical protein